MNSLAGEYASEYSDIALNGDIASGEESDIGHLYCRRCNMAYCPQFDVLFPKQTVSEYLRFYAQIRGLESGVKIRFRNIWNQ
jgi:ABC-type multidrug transport system ATPase subunit